MSITLPTSPSPREIDILPVRSQADLNSAFGGSDQRIVRTGERSMAVVTMPAMSAADALSWQTDVRRSTETMILSIPEPGITAGAAGTPLVNGAAQTGTSLITDGWTARYAIPKGKWISFSVSGLLYLHQVTAAVTANGSGQATLVLHPMLRASPADNAALNFNPAKIEGFISVPDGATTISVDRIMAGLSFTIKERK